MKRYLAFAGDTYYPEPGWLDLVGHCDERAEAEGLAKRAVDWNEDRGAVDCTWWQVVDLDSGQIVAGGGVGFAPPSVPEPESPS